MGFKGMNGLLSSHQIWELGNFLMAYCKSLELKSVFHESTMKCVEAL